MLTNNIASFEQLGPEVFLCVIFAPNHTVSVLIESSLEYP